MLLLVTGASGVGKSTIRELLAPRLEPTVHCVELRDLGPIQGITMAGRQELADVAARRAAALQPDKHLLLCGDPVAAGEVIAAPAAAHAGGIAVCHLDAAPHIHTARLRERGDPAEYLDAHLGFAQWMREHRDDPLPRLDVLVDNGSPLMRWNRVRDAVTRRDWRMATIDTTDLTPTQAAEATHHWVQTALAGTAPVMNPGD